MNSQVHAQDRNLPSLDKRGDLLVIGDGLLNKYVPGEVIVKYKENNIDLKTRSGLLKSAEIKDRLSLEDGGQLKRLNIEFLRTKKSVEETISELRKNSDVEYAEPNYTRKPALINTNDTYKSYLWGLDNVGQGVSGIVGVLDKDIDAPLAWNLSEGSGVVVAVIDSGVAYNHPDLINNMWDGSNCKDDDGVFIGGCNYGYDFEGDDKTPLPDSSFHGTHVAGVIAAEKNNSRGVVGVASQAKIMALKSDLTVSEIVKAIDFAIQNGAKVINASYGDNYYSQTEYDAINRFMNAGGVFVAAAGNDSRNNDGGIPFYPANYSLANIISVAATDQNDNLASFSNYGEVSVDVGAPGTNIYSTVPSKAVFLYEDFEGVVMPNIPNGWSKTGNWGTYNLGGSWGKVLYGDLSYPYENNANYVIDSPTYNLSLSRASISFWTVCDTPQTSSSWKDYMALEYSANGGVSFTQISRWDETYLGGSAQYLTFSIPDSFSTSSFKFRFRWVTDSSDNNYDGCRIDALTIDKFSEGSDDQYDFMQGTSMAAPYVSGAVATLMSRYAGFTYNQIKSAILSYSDSVSSLAGKTSSGKRLNLNKILVQSYLDLNSAVFGVYRFYRTDRDIHFYSASTDEIVSVLNNDASGTWNFEGLSYVANPSLSGGAVPLYRFYRTDRDVHFYTANESEKDYIVNNPWATTWNFEGVAFYVYPVSHSGADRLVYRFYRTDRDVHFYTANESEKDYIVNNPWATTWNFEGTSFKVSN